MASLKRQLKFMVCIFKYKICRYKNRKLYFTRLEANAINLALHLICTPLMIVLEAYNHSPSVLKSYNSNFWLNYFFLSLYKFMKTSINLYIFNTIKIHSQYSDTYFTNISILYIKSNLRLVDLYRKKDLSRPKDRPRLSRGLFVASTRG
jgi:hypothetical protein